MSKMVEKVKSNFCNSVKLSYLTELEIKKVLCPEKPESIKIVQVIVIWNKEKTLGKAKPKDSPSKFPKKEE